MRVSHRSFMLDRTLQAAEIAKNAELSAVFTDLIKLVCLSVFLSFCLSTCQLHV